MRVAVVQTDPAFGRIDDNLAQAIALMDREEAHLYVLPELFTTGYNFEQSIMTSSFVFRSIMLSVILRLIFMTSSVGSNSGLTVPMDMLSINLKFID